MRPSGGRRWWAHLTFTRMNIELTILRKKFEELRQLGAFMVRTAEVGKPCGVFHDLSTNEMYAGRQLIFGNALR